MSDARWNDPREDDVRDRDEWARVYDPRDRDDDPRDALMRDVSVQDERAARVHVFVSKLAGRIRVADGTEMCSGTSNVFPEKASR